jgi:hypothetical protein
VHSNSETAQGRIRGDQGYLMCCEQMLQDDRLAEIWPGLRFEYAQACADLGVTLIRRGQLHEGRPCLRRSLKKRWTWRASTLLGLSYVPFLLRGNRTAQSDPFARKPLLNPSRSKTETGVSTV